VNLILNLILFVFSCVPFIGVVALLVLEIAEYRYTSHYLQMRREEIKRTQLFRMRQRENWQKSRQRQLKR